MSKPADDTDRLDWPSLAYAPAVAWWHRGVFYADYPGNRVSSQQHNLIQPFTRRMLQSRRDKGLLLPEWIVIELGDED